MLDRRSIVFPISLAFTLLSLCLPQSAHAQGLTAQEAIVRIHHFYAAPPQANTVDTIKAGDPATPVIGIATTFLDTMDVLREAVRRGDNLIVTHEPTFYNHLDSATFFTDDPVYKEKRAYMEQHHLVVFRLHDEIHAAATDHILQGVYEALGWADLPHPARQDGQHYATIPRTTLADLGRMLEAKLGIKTLRIEGDPTLSITHIALYPGFAGLEKQVIALRQPDVDVLIAGETSEWETVEYVRDAVSQGRQKALILLGHQASEEPGMERCAKELRVLFPNLRVDHIEAGQPLWNIEHVPAKIAPATQP